MRAALRLARSPDRLRAEILGQLSRALSLRGQDEEAQRAAEEMLALAGRLGDQEGQTEARISLAFIGARRATTAWPRCKTRARPLGASAPGSSYAPTPESPTCSKAAATTSARSRPPAKARSGPGSSAWPAMRRHRWHTTWPNH